MHLTQHTSLSLGELSRQSLSGATIFGPAEERLGHICACRGGGADTLVLVELRGSPGPVALLLSELTFSLDASHALRGQAPCGRAGLRLPALPAR